MNGTDTYEERTYTNPWIGNDELMVHVEEVTGRVVRIYTYVDQLQARPAMYAGNKKYTWTWEAGSNPVFKHVEGAPLDVVLRCLQRRGFIYVKPDKAH